ncbi:MAG: N-acetylmuramoyl-L-alanine amidase [Bacteroidales bacterium]|nr:N-acetylmuramoyl-L-alanine amidase [Bacteroidales bacterium]
MRGVLMIFCTLFLINIYTSLNAQNQVHPGLKTVVIDAGHGGKDPGALGKGGKVNEKQIVLSVATRLGEKINAAYPDVKVIYTRKSDVFIGLHERAMVARRNNADLFISIHCNGSSSSEAKGSSVHILGQNSNNSRNKTDYFERNMSVAQRENSVIVLEDDYKTKYQSFDSSSPESYISHQLQWMAYYESSLLFASEVVDNMIKDPLTPRKIVIDQDIFQVLVEANMPAVLIELAFVTNPTEYRYLSSDSGQNEIAGRLFKAFKSYKTKYDASVKVDAPSETKKPSETSSEAKVAVENPYYSVQIMGLGRLLKNSDPAFKGLKIHSVKAPDSNIYKYLCGRHDDLAGAKSSLADVRKKFPDAFAVKVEGTKVTRIK